MSQPAHNRLVTGNKYLDTYRRFAKYKARDSCLSEISHSFFPDILLWAKYDTLLIIKALSFLNQVNLLDSY